MGHRRDAGLAAARTALAIEEIARRWEGHGTTGQLVLDPGVATVVPGRAELTADLRHARPDTLTTMFEETVEAAWAAADEHGCSVSTAPIWSVAPRRFDGRVVEAVRVACAAVSGRAEPMISGALHDAAEIAARVPSAMVFCRSRGGVSHAPDEATGDRDLAVAVEVFCSVAADLVAGGHVPARTPGQRDASPC